MDAKYKTSRRGFLRATAALAATGALGRGIVAWAAEPDLIVRTAEPYNAEPPLIALVADRITPVKRFYVRNHGPMPKVDPGMLSPEETSQVIAYILKSNGVPAGKTELPSELAPLKNIRIEMPGMAAPKIERENRSIR